ncbi:hypothetical protein V8E53_006053 [Lactarius tabidus]
MIVLWQSSHTTGALSGDEADIGRGRRTRGPRAQSRQSHGCAGAASRRRTDGAPAKTRLSKKTLARSCYVTCPPKPDRSSIARSSLALGSFVIRPSMSHWGVEWNSTPILSLPAHVHYSTTGNLEIVHIYPILARRCDKFFNLGEVPRTILRSSQAHTRLPNNLTLKSNRRFVSIASSCLPVVRVQTRQRVRCVPGTDVNAKWVRKEIKEHPAHFHCYAKGTESSPPVNYSLNGWRRSAGER